MSHCGTEEAAVVLAQEEVEQKDVELEIAEAVLSAAEMELWECEGEH